MPFEISPAYRADELFRPAPHGPLPGKPAHMNISAHRRPGRPIGVEGLQGAGIYGVFLHGRLFYVGIFSGAKTDSLSGTVLTRWRLHLTYQTLRSPNVCFTASDLSRILHSDPCPPFDAIADAVGGRDADLARLKAEGHPLIETDGASCTFRKARFAAQNWELLRPGSEAGMFEAVSFVFARLKPETLAGAAPMDRKHRQWIKSKWLERCEHDMIVELKPICNREIAPGDEGSASIADFERQLAAAASAPFVYYTPADHPPVDPADVDRNTSSDVDKPQPSGEADAPVSGTDLENEAADHVETRFRTRLSANVEAFVDELDQICPYGIEMGFVNIPELRLYGEPAHTVLLRIKAGKKGGVTGFARTSRSVAIALGFDDAVDEGGWARFSIDTQRHQPSAVLALAGAALGTR